MAKVGIDIIDTKINKTDKFKIAFASSDGKVVNQHFGRTQKFLIVEINGDGAKYVEARENIPSCQEFQHTEDAMKKSINLISDCKAVFVARIGHGAMEMLHEAGIRYYETPYFIEDILEKFLNSTIKLELAGE